MSAELREALAALRGKSNAEPARAQEPRLLDAIGWQHWLRFDELPLWQAVAISMGYDPRSISNYGEGIPDLEDRIRLAESHARAEDSFQVDNWIAEQFDGGPRFRKSTVDLVTFMGWAARLKLTMPGVIADSFREAWRTGRRPRP
jgi:hypothetical protein